MTKTYHNDINYNTKIFIKNINKNMSGDHGTLSFNSARYSS